MTKTKGTASLLILGILTCYLLFCGYAQSQSCIDEVNKCSSLATGKYDPEMVARLCSPSGPGDINMCIDALGKVCTDSAVNAWKSFFAYFCTPQGIQDSISYGQCTPAISKCLSAYAAGLRSAAAVSAACGIIDKLESCVNMVCSEAAGRYNTKFLEAVRPSYMCPGPSTVQPTSTVSSGTAEESRIMQMVLFCAFLVVAIGPRP